MSLNCHNDFDILFCMDMNFVSRDGMCMCLCMVVKRREYPAATFILCFEIEFE